MVSTLLIFGCPSWKDWVAPFFIGTSKTVDYFFDKDLSEGAVLRLTNVVKTHTARQIILVSHHDTLLRDSELGAAINNLPEKSCVFQPKHVSLLATDKRQMNEYVERIPSLSQIQEFLPKDVEKQLAAGKGPFVAKQIGLTEGQAFNILRDCADFKQLHAAQEGNLDHFMFQRFIQGIEFSVNAVAVQDRVVVFQPISKSFNSSSAWDHPCRRFRKCPDMGVDQKLIDRLISVTIAYMKVVGAQGLVELEFIVDQNSEVWFLEINPRLSATTRMVSIVSEADVFTTLIKLAAELSMNIPSTVPTKRFSEEFPIPKTLSKQQLLETFTYPEFSFSSRATVSGASMVELQKNVRRLRNFMNEWH